MSLFDQDKVDALTETVVNTLRGIGITVPKETVTFSLQEGQLVIMLMGLVRDDAADHSQEAKSDKDALNQMLAASHRDEMDKKLEEIRKVTTSETSVEEALFGNEECQHPKIHPEGFCIDCGENPDDD
jgi:hypothetical protein